ncbi:dTDP-4-dehydrorhamnose reductase [uncultured Tolumonas sp.]|uniref:dTDP-4-dehydrorhamnose reductase n=1 Tax=uncultured Tolumonas sp. TaxID=263765 RepID=UPI00293142D8|nr:dTDP-4-dehydrorhamnose reductase [uncultured Tolumonas sp.]
MIGLKKILVTGAYGQVGFCLTQLAAEYGWAVLAIDRDKLDITDFSAVELLIKEYQPDVIINAAAHTAVDKAETEIDASYAINRDGPKYLAEAAATIGATILHISTDYVFSGDKEGLYTENDPVAPQGIYGTSKLAGEEAVIAANKKHIILRTAWVFGEHGNNFVKTMLRLGLQRDQLGIVADQFGGPTYAGDIAAALLVIAEKAVMSPETTQWGVYHFAGAPHVSWYQFAQAIFDKAVETNILAKAPKLNALTTADYPTAAKRPANSRLNCDKIFSEFNIRPSNWLQALNNLSAYALQ